MNSAREFRQITFGRKCDVKRLRATLSRTMREVMKNPSPNAAPARVESILIETDETTVFLSGNRPGLNAVAAALRRSFSDVIISKASRDAVVRPPRASALPPQVK
jgi:hypothetical protein